MAAHEVKRLGVIGAGQMACDDKASLEYLLMALQGLGIALVAAQKAGVPVALVDTNQASIDKGLKFAGRTMPLLSLQWQLISSCQTSS